MCGKAEETSNLQDLLIHVCKGISVYGEALRKKGTVDTEAGRFVREAVKGKLGDDASDDVRITATSNEDVRSLRELLVIGIKGLAAYADHAALLGHQRDDVYAFVMEALAFTTKELSTDEMVALVLKAGETAVNTMALLDEANTKVHGNPEITEVKIGVGTRPGILISGYDLKDMEELLEQTKGTGVDVYTHGEMLPAFLSPNVAKVLVDTCDIKPVGSVEEDIAAMMAGK